MSLLPECPTCFGLLTVRSNSKLSSACRCGYPAEITWDNFPKPEDQLTECKSDPFLKRRAA